MYVAPIPSECLFSKISVLMEEKYQLDHSHTPFLT
jgi:hypothetical protein